MREWLDGPGFVAWLEENAAEVCVRARAANGGRECGPYGNLGRSLKRWRDGSAVSVYTADFYLVVAGLHLSMLPDDIYRESPGRGHPAPYIREMVAA